MKPLPDELLAVLTREIDLYSQVLNLVEEERQALTLGSPDRVLDVVRRKDTLLLQIRTVDESRDLICTRLARQWGIARKALTLSEIVERCDGPTATRMSDARKRLRDCVDSLGKAGRSNAALCHSGIETIRRVIEGLASSSETSDKTSPYSRTGSPQAAKRQSTLNLRT